MNKLFADRITDVPKSFIREILKDALMPGTISFAGGLPNRELFPLEEIEQATQRVFQTIGRDVLQYSNSEGFLPLREMIAARYAERGLDIPVESILITSGSQQGLDLLGKTLLNDGDGVIIEEPGYLGAIQAFAIYRPKFLPVPVDSTGMDIPALTATMNSAPAKLLYTVPNFQNPSGITYPNENRQAIADCLRGSKTFLIEDDPYGELRFEGEAQHSFKHLLPENTVMLGSFSKTVVPGFRIGWIVAPEALMEKLIIAKQASDLHTNQLSQCILYQYMHDFDHAAHVRKIIAAYGEQKRVMVESIRRHFPAEVEHTLPQGGMFLWATLPPRMDAMALFHEAARNKVLFVPGKPFYVRDTDSSSRSLRLNYSCVDPAMIETGIHRLGDAIAALST